MTSSTPRGKEGYSLSLSKEQITKIYDEGHKIIPYFVDPVTMMYSCGDFRTATTLVGAQVAKTDLALSKLGLTRGEGQTIVDVGYGYGFAPHRANELYGVKVIGLNISEKQVEAANRKYGDNQALDLRFQDWREFHTEQPVDGIVSIGPLEHFGRGNYSAFFQWARETLKPGSRMLLHTIHIGKVLEEEKFRFGRFLFGFLGKVIFPGGDLPTVDMIKEHSQKAGLELVGQENLGPNYVKTLEEWAKNLEQNKDAAIAATSEETYVVFLKPYLRGTQEWFANGVLDVSQFLLKAS